MAALAACQAALGSPVDTLGIVAQGSALPNTPNAVAETIAYESSGIGLTKEVRTRPTGTLTVIIGRSRAYREQGGVSEILPLAGATYQKSAILPIHLCSLSGHQAEQSISFVGVETMQGRTLQHIHIAAEAHNSAGIPAPHVHDISLLELWLDEATSLPWKSQSIGFPSATSMSRIVEEIFYSDYRPVAGMMVPYTVEHHIAGQKIETTTWTQVAVQTIPPSDFIIGGGK